MEVDGSLVHIALDDVFLRWQGQITSAPSAVALQTDEMAAAFAGFAVTGGWEELFLDSQLEERGWRGSGWHVGDGIVTNGAEATPLIKDSPPEPYELIVNARIDQTAPEGLLGIVPAVNANGHALSVTIKRTDQGWALDSADAPNLGRCPLPASCNLSQFQQFRFRLLKGQLRISWENHEICVLEGVTGAAEVGVFAQHAIVALDMVRVISCAV
jgi:hypothetical protein